jgi:hypothetical protein
MLQASPRPHQRQLQEGLQLCPRGPTPLLLVNLQQQQQQLPQLLTSRRQRQRRQQPRRRLLWPTAAERQQRRRRHLQLAGCRLAAVLGRAARQCSAR